MTQAVSYHNDIKAEQGPALYRTLWRWHFYAGLFCLPFVLILSVTGTIYLFKPQIDGWNERAYQQLSISGPRAEPNEHIASALDAVPHARFLNYRLPESPQQAVAVGVQAQGEPWRVYLHPHSLEVLETRRLDGQFIQWIKRLHGELLIGPAGSILVELAACWAIILLVTGLYLWWPRSARGLAGVLYPRLGGKGRLLWRDLHAVVGFWVATFTLFLLITALPWTEVWGSLFKEVRQWNSAPVEQSWNRNAAQERHHWEQKAASHVDLSPRLLASAQAQELAAPAELTLEDADRSLWKLSSKTQNRPRRADVWLEGANGAVVRRQPFSAKSPLERAVGIGIAAHEGQLFGWFNQLLGVLTALGLFTLSLSGFILWRQRKPDTGLGAPAPPRSNRTARVVAGIVLLAGILLPVVGASLVVLLTLEWALLKRIDPLRQWLGLNRPH